jgi:hypothetical protein
MLYSLNYNAFLKYTIKINDLQINIDMSEVCKIGMQEFENMSIAQKVQCKEVKTQVDL